MEIAILQTGRPPGELADEFGDYPEMFATMLGNRFEFKVFDAENGELPSDPAAYAAYMITGSPAGVYEQLPWIDPLEKFIRNARDSKMVGICFGHQVMAEALGGTVRKSEKGWGAGLHSYEVVSSQAWVDAQDPVAIPASHQDQVVEQPPLTEVVARSEFTPFAALSWKDRPAISFQFHPEFTPAFAKALIERRYDIVPNAEAAIASLDRPNDNVRVAGWITQFLAT